MKIELKRISYNERLSEETSAFAADVWVNGKNAGSAKNAGHGGGTTVFLHLLTREEREEVLKWVKAQSPKVYPELGTMGVRESFSIPFSLEVAVDDLFEAYLSEKFSPENQEKKWVKTKILFALKGDEAGVYRECILKKGGVKLKSYTKAHKDWITQEYGDKLDFILNEKHGQVDVKAE